MKPIHLLFTLCFTLTFLALTSTAESFSINGKPVPEVVATVNGSELTAALLEREVTAYKLIASQQGRNVPDDQDDKIAQGVLMRAIDQELLRQKGVALNISISPQRVDNEIDNIRKKFPSEEAFLHALRFQHLTLDTLKKKIEHQLTSEEFVRREIAPNVQLEEGQARIFYQENAESFIEPEQYLASHIFTSTLPPVEKDKYNSPEAAEKAERMVQAINQSAKEAIEDAYKRLKSGADFTKLVHEISEDTDSVEKDGALGALVLRQTHPVIAEALRPLKVGEFSKPVQSSAGLHIFLLTEKIPSTTVPFEQIESEILNHLLKLETQKRTDELLKQWRKQADIKIFI
ncbi:MAG: hypothetical protein COV66_01340 [Nitrospinae bacterium CG11_big_fil_rev_8_21_14_0_20_45_15]|nr:MAG: hypothetical protein COV66_01340 [Nitrospinae bacterium CG11_big_fil_rev_8_21_14_0_20_45_15]